MGIAPKFMQVNIVVSDMDAAIGYRARFESELARRDASTGPGTDVTSQEGSRA